MSNDPQGADIVFIRALADLLRDSDLTEIEVQREFGDDNHLSVRVARQPAATTPLFMPRRRPIRPPRRRAPPARPNPRHRQTRPMIPAPSPRPWSAPPICRPSRARRRS
jgi:acetyl-CoA carboxylase biotin carboxyl carrier protein